VGFFKSIGKVVSAPVKLVAKPITAAGKGIRNAVQGATKNTPIGGVVKAMTSIDFGKNPIKGVLKAHTTAGKFLVSKEAGAIGMAAATGGVSAAAMAAGGARAAALVNAAKSGQLTLGGAANFIKDNAAGALIGADGKINSIEGAFGQLTGKAVSMLESTPKPTGSKLPANRGGTSWKNGISQTTAAPGVPGYGEREDIITTIIKLPFRVLGLVK